MESSGMGHWFLRVIEDEDGTWRCRRGTRELGWHNCLEDALDHIVDVARIHQPSEVFIHHRTGEVRSLGMFPQP